jgi:plastocyanin
VIVSSRIRNAALAAMAITVVAITFAHNASARTVSPPAPKTWVIKMITDSTTTPATQKFEPKDITIQVGDIVKWVAVSGSHNISFWPDSIPAGAAALLRKALPDTLPVGTSYFTLTTKRRPTAGDSIVVSFAGMPKGVYKYNCRPHLMKGMTAQITVQ